MMKLSQNGLDFLKTQEALRLIAYQDSKGIWTIGWGSTEGVYKGLTITLDQAVQRLVKDLQPREIAINSMLTVPITQYQYDALVSFSFNEGITALTNSSLMRLLKVGDVISAANQFPVWNKVRVDGALVESAGLTNRRRREQALFLHGDYHAA